MNNEYFKLCTRSVILLFVTPVVLFYKTLIGHIYYFCINTSDFNINQWPLIQVYKNNFCFMIKMLAEVFKFETCHVSWFLTLKCYLLLLILLALSPLLQIIKLRYWEYCKQMYLSMKMKYSLRFSHWSLCHDTKNCGMNVACIKLMWRRHLLPFHQRLF
jgi:hypothetical protein